MNVHCTDAGDLRHALADRDPETLLGPLLWLLTRLARGVDACSPAEDLAQALVAHSTALAAHPAVATELRLAAGALAIEHRRRWGSEL
jgi:hypothetical protein